MKLIYLDKLNGLIDEELFKSTQETIYKKLQVSKYNLKVVNEKIQKLEFQNKNASNYEKIVANFLSFKNVSRVLFIQIVDRIEISSLGQVNIYIKCK